MESRHLFIIKLAILTLVVTFRGIFIGVESANLSMVTDMEALISVKSLINAEPANPLSSWDPNSSPCNWTGVFCNRPGQRVVELDLSGLRLAGSISPHIGNLSLLRSLQLQDNQFTGTLPHQLSNLFRLRVLNVSSNRIEGTIPPNMSSCRELRVLDLMQNEISGRIPEGLGQLPELQVLNLGKNHISGAIPPSISNLSSLISLNLGTNAIGGMIPGDLARLRNLRQLDVTINNLTGTVPQSLYNMSSLLSLALASNNLWGELPSDVGVTLPNLLVFNFCFNDFTGTVPGSLHNLTRIQIIRMAHNRFHGTVPPGLGNLPDLRMYNIGFNKIVSSGDDGLGFLVSLTNSTRLNFLAIDGNLLQGTLPKSIGNLSKVLSKFYMGGNRISGSIPASIGHLSGLASLNLRHNQISGEIPSEIGQLGELQVLSLAGNLLSGKIPDSLGDLRKLTVIDLHGNKLVGSIPTSFENFQSLLSFDLSNNLLNGSIPEQILNLHSLSSHLNFSKNFLSGTLPEEIGSLDTLVTIDLSDNRLLGSIPDSIENCKSLEELFLTKNMLSGNIPSYLGSLKGLETLDLSSNEFSGSIPPQLQNLQALHLLNLSFNNLEGEVPSGGVFTNLSQVYMEGNPKLCLHFKCDNSHGRRGRRVLFHIIIAAMVVSALCLTVVLLFFMRKGKEKVMSRSESVKGQHQLVSYNELRAATGNFNQEKLVGYGSFGSVYKGYLREGTAIAVKVLDPERTGSWKSFLAECMALRNVRHRHLVKLITSCSSLDLRNREFLALVYEFISNGNLQDWLVGKRKHANGEGLNILERLNVATDVACAIDYLHHDCEVPVVHCDLKPSNVLLDEDMTAKVGDFGLARLLMERAGDQPPVSSTNALKGSIGYIAPEYGLGEKQSTAGDVYSYGIMLLELFTGKSPTHESFVEGLNLRKWVEMAFPKNVNQVLDPELAPHMGSLWLDDHQSIPPGTQLDGLITAIGVGLSCTAESPSERVNMRDALRKLKAIRDTLLKPSLNKENKN